MYTFFVTLNGVGVTGLTPTFTTYRGATSGSTITSETISAIGGGHYKFSVEWSDSKYNSNDKVVFVIDAGATITNDYERYISGEIYRHDEAIEQVATDAAAAANAATLAAKAICGEWKITSPGVMTIYSTDGTTVLAVFDLKDAAGSQTLTSPFWREITSAPIDGML